ncbi:MAG: ATP-grasp domain-containing protein, partial [Planctomycetota bacterium]
KYVQGQHFSSCFIANHEVHYIGTTHQLLGATPYASVEPTDFNYAGSIGPVEIDVQVRKKISRWAKQIAAEFQIKGCFGIDWLLDPAGQPWLIEVNPRITSSCEVLELSGVLDSFVASHIAAFTGAEIINQHSYKNGCVGKLIVYSKKPDGFSVSRDFQMKLRNQWERRLDASAWCSDIPNLKVSILPGQPVTTILARAENLQRLTQCMIESAKAIKKMMEPL